LTAKLVKEISKKYGTYETGDSSSVWASVGASVWASVWDSVRDSVVDSVWDSVQDSVVDSGALRAEWYDLYSWGQHDANWLGFYDYFREVLKLTDQTAKLVPLTELAKQTGWHLFYKNVAILSEKPTEVHRNERGQLHNFIGPAIKWADGYELYRFNGVRIDGKEQYAKMQSSEFTKEIFTKEENADVRREIIRKIGMERLAQILDYKVIDAKHGYELITFDIGDKRVRPFLKMKNPSIDAIHIEGVPVEVTTVEGAICYRNGLKEFSMPRELT